MALESSIGIRFNGGSIEQFKGINFGSDIELDHPEIRVPNLINVKSRIHTIASHINSTHDQAIYPGSERLPTLMDPTISLDGRFRARMSDLVGLADNKFSNDQIPVIPDIHYQGKMIVPRFRPHPKQPTYLSGGIIHGIVLMKRDRTIIDEWIPSNPFPGIQINPWNFDESMLKIPHENNFRYRAAAHDIFFAFSYLGAAILRQDEQIECIDQNEVNMAIENLLEA